MSGEKIVTVARTLIYTGPEAWVRMCIERAFVELNRELRGGKTITSKWGAIEEVKPEEKNVDK